MIEQDFLQQAMKQRVSPELQEKLEEWANLSAELINAIGPPGDFGYGTKRGDALERFMDLQDVIWDERAKNLTVVDHCKEATRAVLGISWPKDVRNRLPAFYVAVRRLQECEASFPEA